MNRKHLVNRNVDKLQFSVQWQLHPLCITVSLCSERVNFLAPILCSAA